MVPISIQTGPTWISIRAIWASAVIGSCFMLITFRVDLAWVPVRAHIAMVPIGANIPLPMVRTGITSMAIRADRLLMLMPVRALPLHWA